MPRSTRSEFTANLALEPIDMTHPRFRKVPQQAAPQRTDWALIAQRLTPWLALLAFWVLVLA